MELTPEARSRVRTVDVAPEVVVPDDLDPSEPGLAAFGLGGLVSSLWIAWASPTG